MRSTNRTFRIFVSSTFSDLKEERNALQRYVFPRLRDLCLLSGCRFQAIDLRWGVSEEAGRDQQIMKLCLDEIAHCQETTVRPNFIVLLGEGYGWCPLPSDISKIEFDQIIKKITDDDNRKLITQWYRCDENAVPPVYSLKERKVSIAENAIDGIKKAAQENEFEEWRKTEKELRLLLLRAIDQLGWQKDDPRRVKFEASATEQEIGQGVLKPQDAQKHVFCFFRTIKGLPHDIRTKDFRDINSDGNPDTTAKSELKNLKKRLSKQLKGNVEEYNAIWTDEGLSTDHIGSLPDNLADCLKLSDAATIPSALCVDVWRKLSKVITEELAMFDDADVLENEIKNHNEFGENHAKFFVGRASTLKKISDHVKGTDTHPLAVFGASGSGKSAIMARAVELVRSVHKNAEAIVRFIGATPESSDGRALLESLCRQVSRGYRADESTIPNDYKKLVEEFPKRLALATFKKPLFIFLDALDQLSMTDNANDLTWIPRELPPHVHLVVSTLHGEEKKLPSTIRIELEKMLPKEGNELIDLWLKDAKRKLQKVQKKEVLNKFEKSGLPLYLKLAFEEARRWKSYDGIPVGSNGKQGLSEDVPGIIRDMFSRLSTESNHGNMLVSRSMGYLAASKNGLTEDEMLDVLSEDDELYQDFLRRARHTPPEPRLPVVIWSRLYFDLEPYLAERSADGTSLMAFSYHQIREVVVEDYLKEVERGASHRILAEYFGKKPYWVKMVSIRSPNIRKSSMLPYHQAWAGMGELADTLIDFSFMAAKLHSLGVNSLIEDYDLVHVPGVAEKVKLSEKSLRLLQGSLRLSSHILKQDSDQLAPQLFGRLLNFSNPDIQKLLAQAKRCTEKPWLRPLIQCFSPPGGALLRTLSGFECWGSSIAATPDGNRAVTISSGRYFQVWDLKHGTELHTFKDDDPGIKYKDLSITPDGQLAILCSNNGFLKVWNLDHGALVKAYECYDSWVSREGQRALLMAFNEVNSNWKLSTIDPAKGEVLSTIDGRGIRTNAWAITPDGNRAVLGFRDGVLLVFDLEKGVLLHTLRNHTGYITSVAVTPEGKRAVSASRDQTIKVWDLESGVLLHTLKGHWDHITKVNFVDITPDGNRVVYFQNKYRNIMVWNFEKQNELHSLEGHKGHINAALITPDGKKVISAAENIRIWDIASYVELCTLDGHTSDVFAMATMLMGQQMITAAHDGTLKIWDLRNIASSREKMSPDRNEEQKYAELRSLQSRLEYMAVFPDGRRAITRSLFNLYTNNAEFHGISVLDLVSGSVLYTLKGHIQQVNLIKVSPDCKRIITCDQFALKMWSLDEGNKQHYLSSRVDSVALTPDGTKIISSSGKGLEVWDPTTGARIETFGGFGPVEVTPDGRKVIFVSDRASNTLSVTDLNGWNEIYRLRGGHSGSVTFIGITPDGKIAIAASDGVVDSNGVTHSILQVWDLDTGVELYSTRLRGVRNLIKITPDGKWVVCVSLNEIKVYSIENGVCVTTFICEGFCLSSCELSFDGRVIGLRGQYHDKANLFYLGLENFPFNPVILTAWRRPDETQYSFGCSLCRAWSEVPESALGTIITCPNCRTPIKLNPFCINADWRPVAKAWRGDTN